MIDAGVSRKWATLVSSALSLVPVRALPGDLSVADITRQISGLDDLFGNGAPANK